MGKDLEALKARILAAIKVEDLNDPDEWPNAFARWRAARGCPDNEQISAYCERRCGVNKKGGWISHFLTVGVRSAIAATLLLICSSLIVAFGITGQAGVVITALLAAVILVLVSELVLSAALHYSVCRSPKAVARCLANDFRIWKHLRACMLCRTELAFLKEAVQARQTE